MATVEYSSVKGKVARLVRLDECGVPVVGAKSIIVTGGFIRVGLAMTYEDGEEITVKTAWGDLCVNEKDKPRLKRVTPTVDFCRVNPDTFEMVTGARLLLDGADAAGWALGEDPADGAWSLEVWSKVAGTGGCSPTGQLYVYTAIPFVESGKLGDFTLENGAATFTISGESKGANEAWGDGPGAVSWLPGTEEILAGEHIAQNVTDTAPPAETVGAIALAA
jgi:hypothetical protein